MSALTVQLVMNLRRRNYLESVCEPDGRNVFETYDCVLLRRSVALNKTMKGVLSHT